MKISIILDSSEPREKKEKQRKIKIFWKTQREITNTVFLKIMTADLLQVCDGSRGCFKMRCGVEVEEKGRGKREEGKSSE